MSALTTVHLVRHGEVVNPSRLLYGRLPGYVLSDLGLAMAERVAEALAGRPVRYVGTSPLERAQQTAAPIAARHGLHPRVDDRLIEAANVFEGLPVGVGDGSLRRPVHWWHLRNPLRPSWGEPYRDQAARMLAALAAARDAARAASRAAAHDAAAGAAAGPATRQDGRAGEAVLVSHQLPIWTVRSYVEGRRLWHDPRARQCTLASMTSFTYAEDEIVAVSYAEPARDLLPAAPARRLQAGA